MIGADRRVLLMVPQTVKSIRGPLTDAGSSDRQRGSTRPYADSVILSVLSPLRMSRGFFKIRWSVRLLNQVLPDAGQPFLEPCRFEVHASSLPRSGLASKSEQARREPVGRPPRRLVHGRPTRWAGDGRSAEDRSLLERGGTPCSTSACRASLGVHLVLAGCRMAGQPIDQDLGEAASRLSFDRGQT